MDLETEPTSLDVDGERVDVYANLNEDCVSILSRETESEKYGTVIGHADLVVIDDPAFVIRDAGLDRARDSGQRNVHAVVRGEVNGVDRDGEINWNLMVRMFGNDLYNVVYDPFETDGFEVDEIVRQREHDYSVGDRMDDEDVLYCVVTKQGVGAILNSDDDNGIDSPTGMVVSDG